MMKRLLIIFWIPILLCCNQAKVTGDDTDNHMVSEAGDVEAMVENPVKQRFAEMERKALEEPYRGIFVENEDKVLFPIEATGVSTQPIVQAARSFLSKLNPEQVDRTTFAIDDEEWRRWCNVDNGIYDRQGVSLKELNAEQKSAAWSLMQVSLSAKGLQLSKDIMKTDQTLREINNDNPAYDEELYFFTVMGQPSESEPWGWQLDGHHLVINYFVLGDQVVMSPVFMGGEPIITTTGKYKGNTIFQDEQNLGLAFMNSLLAEQQAEATISKAKTRNNNIAEANKDNLTLKYEGLQLSGLSDIQKDDILDLIHQYVSNMREGHQQVKMEEVEEHLENTWFAWVGPTDEEAVFYYRIHSPVVLIEFDHQSTVGVPSPDRKPSRNHIHTVLRTPNGNDYGKDLLRQHLEEHHH